MTFCEFFGLIWPLKKAVTDWWEGGMVGSRGGCRGGGGWRGSVRNISYICSFINLANLASCSAIRLSLGVLCTGAAGAAQIEKVRAVNLIGEGC